LEVYSESLTRKACEDRLTDYLKTSRRRLHEGAELLCECGGCERIIAVPCGGMRPLRGTPPAKPEKKSRGGWAAV